ncbi:hypothetical protein TNCV_936951 [Trichonephila clavipes]|nr:hypothetical protein TNCV_936951 [Trichonephila clavipes]
MNSPDYDDFIDMCSVPTLILPLPPTPVASPSHESSQDVIYDSLPPMEQSTVPESPLKDLLPVDSKPSVVSKPPVVSRLPKVSTPVKKVAVKKVDSVIHRERSPRSRERWNEERRNEERRSQDPRLYRRPDFRQPYRRPDFKPRVFRRPPYAQKLMPTSQKNAQVFFHSQGLAVLCIKNNGFTLTHGVVSYAMDRECPNELFKFLHYLIVGTNCVTNQHYNKSLRKSK